MESSTCVRLESEMASLNTYLQQKVWMLVCVCIHVNGLTILHHQTEYANSVESQLELKQEMLQALQNDLQVNIYCIFSIHIDCCCICSITNCIACVHIVPEWSDRVWDENCWVWDKTHRRETETGGTVMTLVYMCVWKSSLPVIAPPGGAAEVWGSGDGVGRST